ncbi:GGDEF domain-containing protein [Terribacillus saccharophilus]|uniref:GGDEF domain-containing protein n=1 Tax=Terribacillus saccharophilus TaxID=361277 RepID=UPI0039821AB4
MGILHAFTLPSVPKENKQKLKEVVLEENWKRTKLFAIIILIFEAILIVRQLPGGIDLYVGLYLGLFSAAAIYLLCIYIMGKKKIPTGYRMFMVHFFVLFFLTWGTMVTLLDQLHYGHVMAFVVNYMCVSTLFLANGKHYLLFAFPSVIFLYAGLPFYQQSADMLSGHYTNLTVFIFFCWLASQLLYKGFAINFYNKLLLTEMNEELEAQITQNEVMNEQLKKQAMLDELTGVPNRRGFQDYINTALVDDSERQLSLFLLDVDAFKSYNDHYGHLRGDEVLRLVAQSVYQTTVIPTEGWARYGGEEFVLAVFDQPSEKLDELAEAIRQAVQELRIDHAFSPVAERVTVSIGIYSGAISNDRQLSYFIGQADEALYEAKRSGRNTIIKREELSESFA